MGKSKGSTIRKAPKAPTKNPQKPALTPAAKGLAPAKRPIDYRRGQRLHDWESIRQLFIEGVPQDVSKPDGARDWMNLRQLSDQLDIEYQTMRLRAAKERWTELRNQYQSQLMIKRQAERAKRMIGEAVEFDDQALSVAKMGAKLVQLRLGEIARDAQEKMAIRAQALEDMANGIPVDPNDLKTAIKGYELEQMGKSMQMFQEIGMKALGTDIDRHEISGPGGGAIESSLSVTAELNRDDKERLSGFMAAAQRAGILAKMLEAAREEEQDVIEGVVVEEEYVEDDHGEDDEDQ